MISISQLVERKDVILAMKKAQFKSGMSLITTASGYAEKASPTDEIEVIGVGSTAWVFDADNDIVLPGAWNKSVKEVKLPLLLTEHERTVDSVIAWGDDVEYFVQEKSWQSLGFNYSGTTEALLFRAIVRKSENAEMFREYADGNVRYHSVGFFYMKVDLAVNSPQYPEEYANWQKYANKAVNYEAAKATGYAFLVREGKLVEISATELGANRYTPTLSVKNEQLRALIHEAFEQPTGTPRAAEVVSEAFSSVFN